MAENTENSSENTEEQPLVNVVNAGMQDLLFGNLKLEAGKEYKVILDKDDFMFSI